jgi:hypothetical protein
MEIIYVNQKKITKVAPTISPSEKTSNAGPEIPVEFTYVNQKQMI